VTIAERKVREAPGRYPVFASRPTTDFIRRWADDIEKTGKPEGFECVSVDKPGDSTGLHLLSDDIKVPIHKRSDGAMVPCPICSPNSPKFVTGRMAWFPIDRAVRFIGRDCAERHFSDDFRQAEMRFRKELQAIKAQELWDEIGPNTHWLIAAAAQLKPVAVALQECRAHLGWGEQDFPDFFFRVQAGQKTVPLSADRLSQTGQLAGLELLAPDFRPADELRVIRDALEDARVPLPAWDVDQGACSAAEEIVDRGERLQAALKAFPRLLDHVRAARDFLTEANFQTFEKWFASGKSPFGMLVMNIEAGFATIRAASVDRRYTFEFEIPKTAFGPLPSKADVHFRRAAR
jgi:hypothetical protein